MYLIPCKENLRGETNRKPNSSLIPLDKLGFPQSNCQDFFHQGLNKINVVPDD